MSHNKSFNSSRAPEPVGPYPHAKRIGNLLFLSGVGPRKKGDKDIPGVTFSDNGEMLDYDIEVQCKAVFDNVRFILEDSGSSWSNLIDITVFLTNMNEDFSTFNRIYKDYFSDVQPCRTTVEVTALPTPISIELKCIATIE